MRVWVSSFVLLLVIACNSHGQHLVRGQRLYEENKHEEALAVWRVLELNMSALEWGEQARYAYLRGMTDFRLGFRADARHWLALARAIDKQYPGGLPDEWSQHAGETLHDLNEDVVGPHAAAALPPTP